MKVKRGILEWWRAAIIFSSRLFRYSQLSLRKHLASNTRSPVKLNITEIHKINILATVHTKIIGRSTNSILLFF